LQPVADHLPSPLLRLIPSLMPAEDGEETHRCRVLYAINYNRCRLERYSRMANSGKEVTADEVSAARAEKGDPSFAGQTQSKNVAKVKSPFE
jgi:hypothetical protein